MNRMSEINGIFCLTVVGLSLSFARAATLAEPLTEAELLTRVKGLPAEREQPRGVLHGNPDYCVYVPDQTRYGDVSDPKRVGTSYNDHFQVIYDEGRKLFYAFWTQASWEGAGDHHICFAKSSDGGRTWTPPTILAGSERRSCKRFDATWQQPMLTTTGRLYCLWNTPLDSWFGDYGLYGFYSDDGGETWSTPRRVLKGLPAGFPKCWINWQRPIRLGLGGKFVSPSSYCDYVEYWQYENIDENPEIEDIKISIFAQCGNSLHGQRMAEKDVWLPKGAERASIEEGSVVRLPDGRLFMLCRSTTGHPLWSQSRDGGKTWSETRFLRDPDGKPYSHPCSPCPIYDWKGCEAGSGVYFTFIHDTFDFSNKETASQKRGALYLMPGRFDPTGDQPIRFGKPKLFLPEWEIGGNSL